MAANHQNPITDFATLSFLEDAPAGCLLEVLENLAKNARQGASKLQDATLQSQPFAMKLPDFQNAESTALRLYASWVATLRREYFSS